MRSMIEQEEQRQIVEFSSWVWKIAALEVAIAFFGLMIAVTFYPQSLVLTAVCIVVSQAAFWSLHIICGEVEHQSSEWYLDHLERHNPGNRRKTGKI